MRPRKSIALQSISAQIHHGKLWVARALHRASHWQGAKQQKDWQTDARGQIEGRAQRKRCKFRYKSAQPVRAESIVLQVKNRRGTGDWCNDGVGVTGNACACPGKSSATRRGPPSAGRAFNVLWLPLPLERCHQSLARSVGIRPRGCNPKVPIRGHLKTLTTLGGKPTTLKKKNCATVAHSSGREDIPIQKSIGRPDGPDHHGTPRVPVVCQALSPCKHGMGIWSFWDNADELSLSLPCAGQTGGYVRIPIPAKSRGSRFFWNFALKPTTTEKLTNHTGTTRAHGFTVEPSRSGKWPAIADRRGPRKDKLRTYGTRIQSGLARSGKMARKHPKLQVAHHPNFIRYRTLHKDSGFFGGTVAKSHSSRPPLHDYLRSSATADRNVQPHQAFFFFFAGWLAEDSRQPDVQVGGTLLRKRAPRQPVPVQIKHLSPGDRRPPTARSMQDPDCPQNEKIDILQLIAVHKKDTQNNHKSR
ncbi:hypothetical protein QBC36DRAFT_354200 [Triangularia setosa]|uniref:Uncharacterized protein n=1 Tax=Triangularia setosa TaxID=2587417 RepID=A0AAN6W7L2_9PEZI|nr:hypothetical protein QBC36DRAFT_354200 [Podospora setosa]